MKKVQFCADSYSVCKGSDCLVVLTEWNEFKFLHLARVKETMAQPIIFDGRNIYDPERMRRLGFDYYCVGRPAAKGIGNRE